jgi:hypothetical protein
LKPFPRSADGRQGSPAPQLRAAADCRVLRLLAIAKQHNNDAPPRAAADCRVLGLQSTPEPGLLVQPTLAAAAECLVGFYKRSDNQDNSLSAAASARAASAGKLLDPTA